MNFDGCTHSREVGGYWRDSPNFDREEWECGGFEIPQSEWIPGGTESTTVDVDLHRYKCTQCGEIMYYSDAARRHYESGENFPSIKGLDVWAPVDNESVDD